MGVYVHRHAMLAGRLDSLRTTLDKQTLCLAHLFTSYSRNYTCSPRNRGDNRSMLPPKQKSHIVKQHIGQLLVYFIALLMQICFTLCLPLLVIFRDQQSFSFYFSLFVMIRMGFIIAQLDSCRQTSVYAG